MYDQFNWNQIQHSASALIYENLIASIVGLLILSLFCVTVLVRLFSKNRQKQQTDLTKEALPEPLALARDVN